MQVRFWGTRGSIPAPGRSTLRYGGNTSCVEVRTDAGELLIFDGGTGARELGLVLAKAGPVRAHVFIGHTHADHIQGLPFFVPAFFPGSHLTIYGPAGIDRSFPGAVGGQMDYAYFPVPFRELPARLDFEELGEGAFSIGSTRIRAQYLNHTAPCLGYRVEAGGAALVYATDHEPHAFPYWRPDRPAGSYTPDVLLHPGDAGHAELLRDADLVIHDAQYTAAEYPAKHGWGHSPIEYVVDLALVGGVKRLALFHHDPTRDDGAVDAVLAAAQSQVTDAGGQVEIVAAAEGEELTVAEVGPVPAAERGPRGPRLPTRSRILVAEDDDRAGRLLEAALGADGYDVVRATNGAEAVRLAEQQSFDLFLLDIEMPELDGLGACRALRADPRQRDVPIVILTARTREEDIAEGFAHGATDFMTKPFAMSQFRARVRSWLTRAATGS